MGDLTEAVMHLIACGEAGHLGETIGEGFARSTASPSRDQLAAMAMQGLAGNWELGGEDPGRRIMALARNAYAVADAMLAERAKKGA